MGVYYKDMIRLDRYIGPIRIRSSQVEPNSTFRYKHKYPNSDKVHISVTSDGTGIELQITPQDSRYHTQPIFLALDGTEINSHEKFLTFQGPVFRSSFRYDGPERKTMDGNGSQTLYAYPQRIQTQQIKDDTTY